VFTLLGIPVPPTSADPVRACAERDALVHELTAAAGLGRRRLRLGDEAEKARKTVEARIRDVLGRIERVHPMRAHHLRDTISTGTTCAYTPPEGWTGTGGFYKHVLVLASVTGGNQTVEVPAAKINLDFVLGNKVMVGTANGNRDYFEAAIRDLGMAQGQYPRWSARLLTHPLQGLDNNASWLCKP
jgi:hypothetical protein